MELEFQLIDTRLIETTKFGGKYIKKHSLIEFLLVQISIQDWFYLNCIYHYVKHFDKLLKIKYAEYLGVMYYIEII